MLFGILDPTHYAAETIKSCVDQLTTFTQHLYRPKLGTPRGLTLTRRRDQQPGAAYRWATNLPRRRAKASRVEAAGCCESQTE